MTVAMREQDGVQPAWAVNPRLTTDEVLALEQRGEARYKGGRSATASKLSKSFDPTVGAVAVGGVKYF